MIFPDIGALTETSIWRGQRGAASRVVLMTKGGKIRDGTERETSLALSVSMVAISSSCLTKSPTCLLHCFNVPSVMDSAWTKRVSGNSSNG